MPKLSEFLIKYSITTHSVAAVFATTLLAYKAVPQFHDLVLAGYNAVPGKLQTVLTAALALYTWYRNGEK
jgi:hypothetical protein